MFSGCEWINALNPSTDTQGQDACLPNSRPAHICVSEIEETISANLTKLNWRLLRSRSDLFTDKIVAAG